MQVFAFEGSPRITGVVPGIIITEWVHTCSPRITGVVLP